MQDEAFTDLAERYMDTVYRLALSYLKSAADAADVTQEVFLRLYRSGAAFESGEHAKYWLIRVTVNECKRNLAAPWRRAEPLDGVAERIAFQTPERGALYEAVAALPRKYRVVIYLHYYEGYGTAELAKLLRVPKSTVCTRLQRGRELLKKSLTEETEDV